MLGYPSILPLLSDSRFPFSPWVFRLVTQPFEHMVVDSVVEARSLEGKSLLEEHCGLSWSQLLAGAGGP